LNVTVPVGAAPVPLKATVPVNVTYSAYTSTVQKFTRTGTAAVNFANTQTGVIRTSNDGYPTVQPSIQFENDGNSGLTLAESATTSTPSSSPNVFATGPTSTCGSSLASTASCVLYPTFQPVTAVTYAGLATFTDNSPNTIAGAQSVTLSGTCAPQSGGSITFPPLSSPAYVGNTVALTATSSVGLPITYTITSGTASLYNSGAVTGSTLTYTNTGSVTIQASQPGNATYAAALGFLNHLACCGEGQVERARHWW
jgi:hypothetical protein